jgi:hypothetical protein
MPLLLLTVVLSDNTQISLQETAGQDFSFSLIIAGKVECRYDTFDHAWGDLGKCARCTTLEEAQLIAKG